MLMIQKILHKTMFYLAKLVSHVLGKHPKKSFDNSKRTFAGFGLVFLHNLRSLRGNTPKIYILICNIAFFNHINGAKMGNVIN
jgi:hypothetical protein